MQIFRVEEAQEKLESLVAMAFNGEDIRIAKGNDVIKIAPIPEELVQGKIWTREDFYE